MKLNKTKFITGVVLIVLAVALFVVSNIPAIKIVGSWKPTKDAAKDSGLEFSFEFGGKAQFKLDKAWLEANMSKTTYKMPGMSKEDIDEMVKSGIEGMEEATQFEYSIDGEVLTLEINENDIDADYGIEGKKLTLEMSGGTLPFGINSEKLTLKRSGFISISDGINLAAILLAVIGVVIAVLSAVPKGGTKKPAMVGGSVPPARPTGGAPIPPARPTGGMPVPPARPTGGAPVPPAKPTGGMPIPPARPAGGMPVPPARPAGGMPVPPARPAGEMPVPPAKPAGEMPVLPVSPTPVPPSPVPVPPPAAPTPAEPTPAAPVTGSRLKSTFKKPAEGSSVTPADEEMNKFMNSAGDL